MSKDEIMCQNYEILRPERSTSLEPWAAMSSALALAEYDAFTDKLRAALAKQTMDNTAMLCAMENNYSREYPNGAKDFRYIVETYRDASLLHLFDTNW